MPAGSRKPDMMELPCSGTTRRESPDHVAKPVDSGQLYATLLRWLPGGAEVLAEPFTRGDFAAASDMAHSIKGASASLGAVRLPQVAQALESAVKQQRPQAEIASAAEALQQELVALAAGIHTAVARDRD